MKSSRKRSWVWFSIVTLICGGALATIRTAYVRLFARPRVVPLIPNGTKAPNGPNLTSLEATPTTPGSEDANQAVDVGTPVARVPAGR